MTSLHAIRPGDRVDRNIAGAAMALTVTAVDDELIMCGPWTFDRAMGAEIDEVLGLSPAHRATGSCITPAAPDRARIRWRTATGSIYEAVVDEAGMCWHRLSATMASGPLRRSERWPLAAWPDVELGERVPLIGPPYVLSNDACIVLTTPVVEIFADMESMAR